MSGKRDPFFSPVVQQSGSGCATGKKCLEINAINVRGVVKSDTGFIAVVTNNLNKAYFLRENDPVFNGYVVKITGDSVVFQETIQDKLGKSVHAGSCEADHGPSGISRAADPGTERRNQVARRTRGPGPRVGRSEMRKQQLAMFVSLLLVLVVAAAAQTPSQLDRVNVVRDTDAIRVEMSSKGALSPKVEHARLACSRGGGSAGDCDGDRTRPHRRGSAGSRACALAWEAQSRPTTRIVVDLDKACAYELTPGPAGKLVLTLHAKRWRGEEELQRLRRPCAVRAASDVASTAEMRAAPAPQGIGLKPNRSTVFVAPRIRRRERSGEKTTRR